MMPPGGSSPFRQRMLSGKGNHSMDNLAGIFSALRENLKVTLQVQIVPEPEAPGREIRQ